MLLITPSPLVLHPSLRTLWFRMLGSDEQAKAESLFKHVYEDYYTKLTQEQQAQQPNEGAKTDAAAEPYMMDGLAAICHVDFSSAQHGAGSSSR